MNNSLRPLWGFVSFEVYSIQILLLRVKTWYSPHQNRLWANLSDSVLLTILLLVMIFSPYPFHSCLFSVWLRMLLPHCASFSSPAAIVCPQRENNGTNIYVHLVKPFTMMFCGLQKRQKPGKIVLGWNRQNDPALWQAFKERLETRSIIFFIITYFKCLCATPLVICTVPYACQRDKNIFYYKIR